MCLTDTENTFAPRRHFSELKDSSVLFIKSLGDTNLNNNARDEPFVEIFSSLEKNGKYEPDCAKMCQKKRTNCILTRI